MSVINTRLFEAKQHSLVIYDHQAVIDKAFCFHYFDECSETPFEKIEFTFPDYASSYFRVYNHRRGRMILDLSLTRSDSCLIMNASVDEMTFESLGDYYYEIGYVMAVYEQALRYGKLHVI